MGLEKELQFPQLMEASPVAYLGNCQVTFGCHFEVYESKEAYAAGKPPMLKDVAINLTQEQIEEEKGLLIERMYGRLKAPPIVIPEETTKDVDGNDVVTPAQTIYTSTLKVDFSEAKDVLDVAPNEIAEG